MAAIAPREPISFTAGDSLIFQRTLRDYPAGEGWSLNYLLRGTNGEPLATVNSTAAGSDHLVSVDSFAADVIPGDYTLVGFAVKGAERHQIYNAELNLTPDFGTGAATGDTTTHTQRMITLLEAGIERLAAHELSETNVERTQIIRANRIELEKQLAINQEKRNAELARERVSNGRKSGNFIQAAFKIA